MASQKEAIGPSTHRGHSAPSGVNVNSKGAHGSSERSRAGTGVSGAINSLSFRRDSTRKCWQNSSFPYKSFPINTTKQWQRMSLHLKGCCHDLHLSIADYSTSVLPSLQFCY
mmetsp:Transcript_13328/g.31502  ORF Transcript_13328/g.31502 Transcript_13328/m.31502 type:complete len:112 (-) Transcript_13328:66-401(-)